MSGRPQWSYVQARLQARHGERLQEADWRALEAAQSTDQFIERSRATSLLRFTAHLNARMPSHVLERLLRAAWRAYVAEVAAWVAADWHPAVVWTSYLPDLPAIEALRHGEAPDWTRQDPVLAELVEGDPRRHAANPAQSTLAPLLAPGEHETTLAARWYGHWRSLWPAEDRPLVALADTIKLHVERLGRAGRQETSGPYRRDLAQAVARMFRRHGGSPVAVFCHLALVALDLERLRGNLVRRRLFQPGHAGEAA